MAGSSDYLVYDFCLHDCRFCRGTGIYGRLGARGRDLASDEIQREEIEGGDPDISRGSLGHGCHCDIATGRIAPPLHIIKEKRANR